ncbi:MAG: DUF4395 family protein [Gemmatimonadota bacterium]
MEADRRKVAERNFILQQGLAAPPPASCTARYRSLVFQPRIVGLVVIAGVLLQSPAIFLALGAVLWWSALNPRWNPFDAIHNATLGSTAGGLLLSPAPAPRRFSQGMAGTFALSIGIFLLLQWLLVAYVAEVLMLGAVAAIVFGRFCLGSFLYHLLRGQGAFARRTLPWRRDDEELKATGT